MLQKRREGLQLPKQQQQQEKVDTEKVLSNLKNTIENFKAGSISSHFYDWAKITSDKWILDIVVIPLNLNLSLVYQIHFIRFPFRIRKRKSFQKKL